ncbi:sensor histidine kinase [Microbacterium terrisoli]|uniref:sensor histidine kinase n=1 Tax=Microbacterium terrisoli TaxID=3242192 RepID=UPI002804A96F|nr:histidine kinase [Microbacterium protaetiae]
MVAGRWNIVVWALSLAAALVIASTASALGATVYGTPVAAALLFGLCLGVAIPLGLAWPRVGTAAALIAIAALTAWADPTPAAPWPVAVPTLIGCCLTWIAVGLRGRWYVVATGWIVSLLAPVLVLSRAGGADVAAGAVVANLVTFATVSLAAAGLGILARSRDAVRAQLADERAHSAAEVARREAIEDRARIARELHDVVAHGMSAIHVRAASARYRMMLSDEAAQEFDELAATARASMAEMRVILGVLRDEDHAEAAPQPGLGDVDALIVRSRELGPVEVNGAWQLTDAERADALLGLTAYRVLQEALANVSRHAPGAAATVHWEQTDRMLRLTVRNGPALRTLAARSERGGQGLRGMRERVQALGGTVQAGPVGDGFEVQATLPRADAAAAASRDHDIDPEEGPE